MTARPIAPADSQEVNAYLRDMYAQMASSCKKAAIRLVGESNYATADRAAYAAEDYACRAGAKSIRRWG